MSALEAAYQAGDMESIRRAWLECRSQLLPEWIRANPGTRPWAWWQFDAPARRERADGVIHPFNDRCRKAQLAKLPATCWVRQHAYDLFFGVPRLRQTPDEMSAAYESEAAYLSRHNLLTDAEQREIFG